MRLTFDYWTGERMRQDRLTSRERCSRERCLSNLKTKGESAASEASRRLLCPSFTDYLMAELPRPGAARKKCRPLEGPLSTPDTSPCPCPPEAFAKERKRRHRAELATRKAQMQATLETLTRANEALRGNSIGRAPLAVATTTYNKMLRGFACH